MARKPRSKGAGSSGIPPIVMPHIDTLWFKRRLADRKISGRQAAAKLGMGPAGFSYMLRGRRMLQMDEAAAFAQLLGVSFDEVVIRAGIQRDLVRADRMTTVRLEMDAYGEIRPLAAGVRPGTIETPPGVAKNASAALCKAPGPMHGWVLFFQQPATEGVQPEAVGKAAVVHADGRTWVKFLAGSFDDRGWRVFDWPGQTRDEVLRLTWATPVLWIRASG